MVDVNKLNEAFREEMQKNAQAHAPAHAPQGLTSGIGIDTFCAAWPLLKKKVHDALGDSWAARAAWFALNKVVIPEICPAEPKSDAKSAETVQKKG